MPGIVSHVEDQYSTWTGLVYVFNLIVGTGALTLPAVFNRAGWLLGLTVICTLAFISFITVTFVIETMASANAIMQWKRLQQMKRVSQTLLALQVNESQDEDSDEDQPLVSPGVSWEKFPSQLQRYYMIQEKIEMGQMASLFFTRGGRTLFFLCFAIYLYGDLSIYGTAVAKSLADVACTYQPANYSCNMTLPVSALCWENSDITRADAYRIFLGVFICTLGPFVFFNVQKTKYLQILTSVMRWLAFGFMTVYAAYKLIVEGPKGHPPAADLLGVPSLFGACVYSFMCHHSLPALVAPIADKSKLTRCLALDYLLITVFYLLLAMTGAFAFQHLDDLYTLDFGPRGSGDCNSDDVGLLMKVIEYFLALFPVFTLSTSFPIIAITLRNNLKSLFLTDGRHYRWCIRKVVFPLLAIVPPFVVAFTTEDLKKLVAITGSYAGAGIQYFIPAALVLAARKKTMEVIGMGVKNDFSSPFSGRGWVIFVIIWAIACLILVSVNFIKIYVM
ncbi:transmembrane protein 104 homolog isoform X3 [Schistocerca gregaria]|uniref:transmembrane protein 104 homolog isoform X3 n=1 Tax=Schistocerca gregaria TaxID=7010 RepID=UPI00211DB2A4|nr:transmembrane protein 104 homolog isoform X3 [Schistocerca gregaria]